MITTTKGELDEATLQRIDGRLDNEDEETTWVEHWQGGDKGCAHTFNMNAERLPDGSHVCLTCSAHQVKREVNMRLKRMPKFADGTAAPFTF